MARVLLSGRLRLTSRVWGVRKRPSADLDPLMERMQQSQILIFFTGFHSVGRLMIHVSLTWGSISR